MRRACITVAGALALVPLFAAGARATPVATTPCVDPPSASFGALPTEVAEGRWFIVPTKIDDYAPSATIYALHSDGTPWFDMPTDDLVESPDEYPRIRLDDGDSVYVELRYDADQYDPLRPGPPTPCLAQLRSHLISAVSSTAPTPVTASSDDVALGVVRIGGRNAAACWREAATPITIAIAGRTIQLDQSCGTWSRSYLGFPGLRVRFRNGATIGAARITFEAIGQHARRTTKRITVLRAGRVLRRFRVVASVRRIGGEQIWQGTDGFVNYCINRLRPVYSSGGRLYCVDPGYVERSVTVRPTGARPTSKGFGR